MKRIITAIVALALGLTATACTTPEDNTGRISYEVEAYYINDGTTRSVLSDITLLVRVETSRQGAQVRDGATGAWLVLPWQFSGDVGLPIRRQFTYDKRNTGQDDITLTVNALVTADPGVRFKCTLFDTNEEPFKTTEVTIGANGQGDVTCISH
jgi:hypothetical protein